VPAPGPGEVTVRVRAAGVNPVDLKLYSGGMGRDAAKLPMRLGFEVSGVVSAVGEGAVGPAGEVRVGDEVIGFRISGGYAQEVTVPAAQVLPKPAPQSWEQAAGMMLTGVTAVHALTATGVTAGDTVLVHGVSGGVGLTAAQIALLDGARVVGTAGEHRHDDLRRRGVVPVAYGEGLAERVRAAAPDGVDAAVDAVGTDEAVDASLALVRDRRRIATVVAFARAPQEGIKALGGGPGADPGTEIRSTGRMRLVQLAAQGQLDVVVARTFPLEEAAQAHRFLAQGHPGGKVVLVP
jgi:NADPH:quinone reductase-like Zn-dependent oxidoreductase